MVKIIPQENTEQRYEDLAKAIIIQAANDFMKDAADALDKALGGKK